MKNRNSSAGNAAQKWFKCPLIQRPAIILAMLLLCAVLSTEAQTLLTNPIGFFNTDTSITTDTIKVMLLISDTATNFYTTKNYKKIIQRCEGCMYDYAIDTTKYINASPIVITAYSVRRKQCCVNGYSGNFAVYQPAPYYTHLEYLDDKKLPLLKSLIVWQAVSK
jgi:hypothetical protein